MDHSVLTDKNCYRHFKIVKALSFVKGLLYKLTYMSLTIKLLVE